MSVKAGDMVRKANGSADSYMVLRVLPEDRVRIRRWPITVAPPAEDVDLGEVIPCEHPHLRLPEDHE